MANQTCPKCGSKFPEREGFAKSLLSTLMPAPAVRDMATQVRCPNCQYVFAESEVRWSGTLRSRGAALAIWLLAAAVFGWAMYQLLWA